MTVRGRFASQNDGGGVQNDGKGCRHSPIYRHTRNFNFGYPVFLRKALDSQPLAENDGGGVGLSFV
ncbi:MAG: hypothetical protein KAJ75_04340 [Alphaproteobacteria bacterium]|nr:hypothetical protein [Alphaproteobacteria bacterium]